MSRGRRSKRPAPAADPGAPAARAPRPRPSQHGSITPGGAGQLVPCAPSGSLVPVSPGQLRRSPSAVDVDVPVDFDMPMMVAAPSQSPRSSGTPVPRQVRKTPPAIMDLEGDLRSLAPCEIAAALYSQNQREEFDDVNNEQRKRELERWKAAYIPDVEAPALPDGAAAPASQARHHQSASESFFRAEGNRAKYDPDKEREKAAREKTKMQYASWERECDSDDDDEEFRNAPGARERLARVPLTDLDLVGRTTKHILRHKPAKGSVGAGFRLMSTGTTKISVDKLTAVQRLVFSLVWQQVDLLLVSAAGYRRKWLHHGVVTLHTAAAEVEALRSLQQGVVPVPAAHSPALESSPVVSVLDDGELPPWRVASGDLVEVFITLADGSVKVLATTDGWYVSTTTNNMPYEVVCARSHITEVEKDVRASPPYPSLFVLLRDYSEAFREYNFDAFQERTAAGPPRRSSDDLPPAPVPDALTVAGSGGDGLVSPSSRPSVTPRHGASRHEPQHLAPDRPAGRITSATPPPKPATPPPKGVEADRATPVSREVHTPTPAEAKKTLKTQFLDRERQRREVVNALKRYQMYPDAKEAGLDTVYLPDSDSSDGEVEVTLKEGVSIMDWGPQRPARKAGTKKPGSGGAAARALPADGAPSTGRMFVTRKPEAEGNRVAAVRAEPHSSDESDERETLSTVLRRRTTDHRSWNELRPERIMGHYTVSDLMTLGQPQEAPENMESAPKAGTDYDVCEFVPNPPERDAQGEATIAPQWITFLQPTARKARMLFALRSMLEVDLTIPANHAVLHRNNAFNTLVAMLGRATDYRIRICAARVLLVCCQNTDVVKTIYRDVAPALVEVLGTGYDEHPRRKGPKAPTVIKSGQLSRMAAAAAGNASAMTIGNRSSHEELLAVVAFVIASMALSVERARVFFVNSSAAGHAAGLLCGANKPEHLRTALLHLLRSLVWKGQRNGSVKSLTTYRTVDAAPVGTPYVKSMAAGVGTVLASPHATSRELQAAAGAIAAYRHSQRFLVDCGAASVQCTAHLCRAIADMAAALAEAGRDVYGRVRTEGAVRLHQPMPTGVSSISARKRSALDGVDTHSSRCMSYVALHYALECVLVVKANADALSEAALDGFAEQFLLVYERLMGNANVAWGGPLRVFPDPLEITNQAYEDAGALREHTYLLMYLAHLAGVLAGGAMHANAARAFLGDRPAVAHAATTLISLDKLLIPPHDDEIRRAMAGGGDGAHEVPALRIVQQVKANCALLLHGLARIPTGIPPVLVECGSAVLYEIQAGTTPPVSTMLCQVIRQMVLHDKTGAAVDLALQKAHLTTLWTALLSFDLDLRAAAAQCLAALVAPADADRMSAGLVGDRNTERFLGCVQDRLPVLITLLDPAHPSNALVDTRSYTRVQAAICDLVASVSHYRTALSLLETQGLLDLLIEMCSRNDDPELLASATHCLWLAAEHMPRVVEDASAISITADKLCTGNPQADKYIVSMIKALVTNQEACSRTCIDTGIVGCLVTLLGSQDRIVQSTVSVALATIRRNQQTRTAGAKRLTLTGANGRRTPNARRASAASPS
eukprot:TRINITY_DN20195_c0_g2_i1.p1 TRINITY_DN20195_c0_g2~~TRINITY_DN20195_c0_g2_i1.p1  ORF type:complete len:1735 (+),score=524.32 TRINITY_DN20195_c0_g2_i1:493-5205(+)